MSENGKLTVKEWENKYDLLLQRYDSLVEGVQKLQINYDILMQERNFYVEQLDNAEQNIGQQKGILVNVITENNRVKDEMAGEIAALRTELRKLDGNNDRLGN